jgi:transcriptional regulator with XRE-family HTH domain
MMNRMTRDWAKLAGAIRAAREARGLTQIDLAEKAGVSEGTIQNLESNEPRRRIPPSLAKVEPHLGWAAGSGLAVLEGGEPTLVPVVHEASATLKAARSADKIRDDLPLRIVDELESDGPLLDSAVIRLPGTGDARMTIVVRGNRDATPEQIQEALLEWRKTERKLHRLPDGDNDEPQAANGS